MKSSPSLNLLTLITFLFAQFLSTRATAEELTTKFSHLNQSPTFLHHHIPTNQLSHIYTFPHLNSNSLSAGKIFLSPYQSSFYTESFPSFSDSSSQGLTTEPANASSLSSLRSKTTHAWARVAYAPYPGFSTAKPVSHSNRSSIDLPELKLRRSHPALAQNAMRFAGDKSPSLAPKKSPSIAATFSNGITKAFNDAMPKFNHSGSDETSNNKLEELAYRIIRGQCTIPTHNSPTFTKNSNSRRHRENLKNVANFF